MRIIGQGIAFGLVIATAFAAMGAGGDKWIDGKVTYKYAGIDTHFADPADACKAVAHRQVRALSGEGAELGLGLLAKVGGLENVAVLGSALIVGLQEQRSAPDEGEADLVGTARQAPAPVDLDEEVSNELHRPPLALRGSLQP